MSETKDIPPVPDSVEPDLRKMLLRVREALQTLLGLRGDGRGAALTASSDGGTGGGGTTIIVSGGGGSGGSDPDPTPPPTPSDLAVVAGFSEVTVSWSGIGYLQGHGHKQTNIYAVQRDPADASPPPTFGDAARVDTAPNALTLISIPSELNTKWYVWAKFETRDGIESFTPAGGTNGVQDTTGQDITGLLAVLTDQITESELFADLNARIDLIDGPDTLAGSVAQRILDTTTDFDAAITSEASARASADSATASTLSGLAAQIGQGTDFEPYVVWDFNGTADGWTAQGATLSTGAEAATLVSTGTDPQVRSAAGQAINGARYDKVRARIRRTDGTGWGGQLFYAILGGHGESGSFLKTVADLTIVDQWTTIEWDMAALTAGGSDWITHTIDSIRLDLGVTSSDTFNIDWIAVGRRGSGISQAALATEQSVRASADSALASSITSLTSTVTSNLSAAIAAVNSEASARASADSALASNITTVQSSIVTRSNLLPNGGFEFGMSGWAVVGSSVWGAFDNGWGRSAIATSVPDGVGALQSQPFSVFQGVTYIITGDSAIFAASGNCYFDMLFLNAAGAVVLDGPQNPINATHDFSTTDANRNVHAVQATAPSTAVTAVARFVWTGTSITTIACRQIKVEQGSLPASRYSAEGASAALVASVQVESSTRATVDGYLGAQFTVRAQVTDDGRTVVGGFGLSATSSPGAGPTIDFGVIANRFWVAAPSGTPGAISSITPFVIQTTTWTDNGVSRPAGVYMDAAFIQNLQAVYATIATLVADAITAASINVSQLTAGTLSVGASIQSTNFSSGSAGWRIKADGTAEFSGVIVRGTIATTAGSIGGITIGLHDIRSSNYVPGTTGFRISDDGSADFAAGINFSGTLSAPSGSLGSIVLSNFIRAGQTAYNTGTGFWLGFDSGVPKFSIGDPSGPHLTWDGTNLTVVATSTGTTNSPQAFGVSLLDDLVAPNSTTASVSVRLNADGTVDTKQGISGTFVHAGNWYAPTTAGIGANFRVQTDVTGDALTSGPTGTTVAGLGSGLIFTQSVAYPGPLTVAERQSIAKFNFCNTTSLATIAQASAFLHVLHDI